MKKKQQNRQKEKFVSTEIKQNKMANEDYQKIRAFVIVLVIVLALVGLLFLFNGKVVTKDLDDNKTTTTTEPSYDESVILGDEIFNKGDKEYMVLLFDSDNKENGVLFSGLFSGYRGSKTLYGVDKANQMNKKHFSETNENENTKPTKASEVVVGGPRLLIIKDKKVSEYISDANVIVEKLRAK